MTTHRPRPSLTPFSHAHLLHDQPLPAPTGSTALVFLQPTPPPPRRKE